jgi:peptidyl-tRNA hydrolase, PTH1 family
MQQPLDLIVGLGNPGPEYQLTRHNAGFWFADLLARSQGVQFKREKKLHGEMAEVSLAGQRLRVLKPLTFMNRSGQSVAAAISYYKIAVENMLVVYDELDLPAGKAKLKLGGGAAGHNGVRSVAEHVGANFWRLRIGVGHPGPGRRDEVINHVLQRAAADEEQLILETVADAIEAVGVFVEQGAERAKTQLHSRKVDTSGKDDAPKVAPSKE